MACDLSIIIPVVNEAGQINLTIDRIREQRFEGSIEIIVSDGHPDGTTIKQVKDRKVICITALPGRSVQMNAGASHASGNVLLFLHCDTVLPRNGLQDILQLMKAPFLKAGAFDLTINRAGVSYRVIERSASYRSRLTRIPYGDQAIFIKRAYFFKIGQYHDIPIMEDVDLMRRVKKNQDRIGFLKTSVLTSARRWEKEGLIFCTLRNWFLMALYLCGVSPERLSQWYKNH